MQFFRKKSYTGVSFHRFSDSWNNRFAPAEVVSEGFCFSFFSFACFLGFIDFLGKLVGETGGLPGLT